MSSHPIRWSRAALYMALVGICAIFLFPFYWMVNSSLKGPDVLMAFPPRFLPWGYEKITLPRRIVREVALLEGAAGVERAYLLDGVLVAETNERVAVMRRGEEWTQDFRVLSPESLKLEAVSPPLQYGPCEVQTGRLADGARVAILARQTREGVAYALVIPLAQVERDVWQLARVPRDAVKLGLRLAPQWRNYKDVLLGLERPFAVFFKNTFVLAALATIGQLLSSSLAAFAFARLRFKGRDALFLVLLATMMVPGQIVMIPLFIGFKSIGWVDSLLPLVVPQFCAGAFNVFLLRQFFLTIPIELDEAAELDGCSKFGIYWRIILPLSKPALIVVGVFTFVWFWKDLMGPLIYLDSPDKHTISLGLEYLRNPHKANAHLLMAAATMAMIPVALLFFAAQRYILRGIAMTGLKG